MGIEEPIDANEAAKMLGVLPRTVIRLAQEGEIRGFKVRDVWRFYRSDIEAYIQRQIERARQQKAHDQE
jgi:excisionase family DNA binding protein